MLVLMPMKHLLQPEQDEQFFLKDRNRQELKQRQQDNSVLQEELVRNNVELMKFHELKEWLQVEKASYKK